jgi:hypothetical protein
VKGLVVWVGRIWPRKIRQVVRKIKQPAASLKYESECAETEENDSGNKTFPTEPEGIVRI